VYSDFVLYFQIFSIVVFGCLADKAYAIARGGNCMINDSVACDFGIAVGVVGMVMCLGFFTIDVLYIIMKQNRVSSYQDKTLLGITMITNI